MLFQNRLARLALAVVGTLLLGELAVRTTAEVLWFQEVGYLPLLLLRMGTQAGLWLAIAIGSAVFLLGNLELAERCICPDATTAIPASDRARGAGVSVGSMRLRVLLPVVVVLAIAISLLMLHYLQIGGSFFRTDWSLPPAGSAISVPGNPENYTLPTSLGERPLFEVSFLRRLWQQLTTAAVSTLGAIAFVMLVLMRHRLILRAVAVLLSIFFASIVAANWTRVLLFLHAQPFERVEPLFGRDIGFYVFKLPIWELLNFFIGGLFWYALLSASLIYLLAGNSISQGKFLGFSYPQLRHLYFLGSVVSMMLAVRHALARFELLYSARGVTYGASYTDIAVQLPTETVLSLIAASTAIWLMLRATPLLGRRRILGRSPWVGLALYVCALLLGATLSPVVQRVNVQPNELDRELSYIERSIKLTRAAFGLDAIDVQTFDPEADLTADDLRRNSRTIRNIRLWDARTLLATNRQLQQIRLYYKFPDADMDRYTLLRNPLAGDPTTERQQVLISARELDFSAVPAQAQTWLNKHLIYTHGYGFTLSPVNQVGEGGLPEYFVKDIATGAEAGDLETASESIRDSIPIGLPRIYFGELTDTYILTNTRKLELDFPSGEDNVYTTYAGSGGISVGSLQRRLLFASYLKDWQMLLTRNLTPDTMLLMRRNIKQRIQAIAPFLRFDGDPYLVTADTGSAADRESQNYLKWIVDAYTISDRYPYSDPGKYTFNYIRNSVKIVVDAYNGDVTFYLADPTDPIARAWSDIFPDMFVPLDAMPEPLSVHIRYPLNLFQVQAEQLLAYHMTDPQVFYNREDQWQIPREVYGSKVQSVKPDYLIMKLPMEKAEEFVLLMPFAPTERNNMIAWLAGRSDGRNYGKQLLYQFPRQRLIFGPEQIEALINQDPIISQQIALWDRQGSRAVQGDLLVIPIERSLLYVEPVYLEAESNSLPTLVRVIVVFENRIAMANTLEGALQAIFEPGAIGVDDGEDLGLESSTTPIVRPVESLPEDTAIPSLPDNP
ncbi:hypothetical protein KR51_00036630 [Rubidibacter lacunae KORDI 51-2]|uniref:UPF0182 protein KR51_00036630 n=1 Tax=Rubidibacter lacunae KORDI 51-2 TaxID=582515 RepID=U5DJL3_9CHRO|nr:UPF0182 family protein [Rubidibacter lacunae]ERN39880.1 hypothetical protein KR51_00036630 [Rubidibacter lacunae KORDI 51-2]